MRSRLQDLITNSPAHTEATGRPRFEHFPSPPLTMAALNSSAQARRASTGLWDARIILVVDGRTGRV